MPFDADGNYLTVDQKKQHDLFLRSIGADVPSEKPDAKAEARRLGIAQIQAGMAVRYSIPSQPTADFFGRIATHRPVAAEIAVNRYELSETDSAHKHNGIVDTITASHIKEVYADNEFPSAKAQKARAGYYDPFANKVCAQAEQDKDGETVRVTSQYFAQLSGREIDLRAQAKRLGKELAVDDRVRYGLPSDARGQYYGEIIAVDKPTATVTIARVQLPDLDSVLAVKATDIVDNVKLDLVREVFADEFPRASVRVENFSKSTGVVWR
jgi:hypothetical protein